MTKAFCSMLYRPIATVQSDETPEFRIIFATTKSVHGVRKELIMVYTIISSFLTPWTDFVVAKMILNSGVSSDWTVAIGLYNMLQKALVNSYFSRFCAGGVLVAVPISILFVIMQKFYVEGITSGAAKG